jgi:hypothetical protein
MSLVDVANKIPSDILSIDDAILAISVMDMKGNILASQYYPKNGSNLISY